MLKHVHRVPAVWAEKHQRLFASTCFGARQLFSLLRTLRERARARAATRQAKRQNSSEKRTSSKRNSPVWAVLLSVTPREHRRVLPQIKSQSGESSVEELFTKLHLVDAPKPPRSPGAERASELVSWSAEERELREGGALYSPDTTFFRFAFFPVCEK